MTRRSALALALAATGALAPVTLAACGRGTSAGSGGTAGFELVGSSRSRTPAETRALGPAVAGVQDFGAAAFRTLAAGKGGNMVLSPVSIHVALAMAALGARGRTAAEMLSTLHATDTATLGRGLNALTTTLTSRAGTVQIDPQHSVTIQLDIADALWGQRGVTWAPAFLDALSSDFGAGMRVVDFHTRPEQARQAINGWVGDVTHHTIPQLLAPGVVDAATRLALVNALYLKAPWAVPFEPRATRTAPFIRADGTGVQVPFMHQTGTLEYGAGPGWQAVRVPYAGRTLAMTLVLPDAGQAVKLTSALDGQRLRSILAAPRPTSVELALPRWRTRTSTPLTELLKGLGMTSAFSPDADFSGMTTGGGKSLTIDAVIHEGYVAVDEAGTEASAATAVVMTASAALTEPRTVIFGRPFLYVLHDVETGAPMFIGRIADPTAS
ncbi:MAG TPA: serpin family protein [Kineosporiaceae bacterium]